MSDSGSILPLEGMIHEHPMKNTAQFSLNTVERTGWLPAIGARVLQHEGKRRFHKIGLTGV